MGITITKKDIKTSYLDFLESKKHSLSSSGFDPVYIPSIAFDFQKEIIERVNTLEILISVMKKIQRCEFHNLKNANIHLRSMGCQVKSQLIINIR